MQPTIHLREATLSDLELLLYWDTKPHVIASDPDDSWEWEDELKSPQPIWREQLIAELDGEPIGFLQIIDPFNELSHYWGEVEENLRAIDIWIGEEENLGKSYGTQMMKLAFERCFANPKVSAILIDPLVTNKRAIKFYKKLGFTFVEFRTFGNSKCYVMKIEREQYETNSVKG